MTNEDKKKMYGALAAPFPESCIQRTDGKTTGKGYSTSGIGYQFVVNRLNEVLGVGGWRAHRELTVKEITTGSGRKAYECVCDLILELGEWVDGEFQVFAEALADGGHTSMSEADSRKGAYTNGLKKAAAMFGVGRQAYEGTLDDDNLPAEGNVHQHPVPAVQKPVVAQSQPVTQQAAPAPTSPASPGAQASQPAQQRNRLTAKQLSAIWAIARKLGMDQHGVRGMVKGRYNLQPEFLGRAQASELIGELSRQAGNGHADNFPQQPGVEG
jgi:hypothetical protein